MSNARTLCCSGVLTSSCVYCLSGLLYSPAFLRPAILSSLLPPLSVHTLLPPTTHGHTLLPATTHGHTLLPPTTHGPTAFMLDSLLWLLASLEVVAQAVKGQLYVCAGFDGTRYLDSIETYVPNNPETHVRSTHPHAPPARSIRPKCHSIRQRHHTCGETNSAPGRTLCLLLCLSSASRCVCLVDSRCVRPVPLVVLVHSAIRVERRLIRQEVCVIPRRNKGLAIS